MKAKGPTMLPTQYEMKKIALTVDRFVDPATFAVSKDIIIENEAV